MMTAIRSVAAGLLVSALVVMWTQYKRLDTQQQLIEHYQGANSELQAGIATMVDAYADNSQQMQQVLRSQQRIQQNLSARQTEIRRLQSDVEEIRVWADYSLPDAVIRMRRVLPAREGAHIERAVTQSRRQVPLVLPSAARPVFR